MTNEEAVSGQDQIHVAMPKLYGAPASGRAPQPDRRDRPFDPDDLPLEAYRSADDDGGWALVSEATSGLEPVAAHPGDHGAVGALPATESESRRRGMLGRMLGGGDHR
jgi:hypothetical protein